MQRQRGNARAPLKEKPAMSVARGSKGKERSELHQPLCLPPVNETEIEVENRAGYGYSSSDDAQPTEIPRIRLSPTVPNRYETDGAVPTTITSLAPDWHACCRACGLLGVLFVVCIALAGVLAGLGYLSTNGNFGGKGHDECNCSTPTMQ